MATKLEDLFLEIPCARCEAKVGEKCTSITGGRATAEHAARREPIHQAFFFGYEAHQQDANVFRASQ